MRVHNSWYWILILAGCFCALERPVRAELQTLAYYRLGELDIVSTVGSSVQSTVDSAGGDAMRSLGTVTYSDDTPPDIVSDRAAYFDGVTGDFLFNDAQEWSENLPAATRYQIGMEAWLKPDPLLAGQVTVPLGNGAAIHLSIDPNGYYRANGCDQTPPSRDPVRFGQWQHVAFTTDGDSWQLYVDGEPQYEALPQFCYGPATGAATIGASDQGSGGFIGWIDEVRTFSWGDEFDRSDLLFFSLRQAGDVNEDGFVDQSDYNLWRANVGTDLGSLTLLEGRRHGDLNGDRVIDLMDFGLIKANRSPHATIIVPEPTAVVTLLSGVVIWYAWPRRRAQREK